MVNVGFNPSTLLGMALFIAGVGLFALRSLRPNLARDYDIFFSAVSLLCGGILFFQGWRQDPILQFGQFLLTGSAVFFAVENVRLRGAVTQQAKRTVRPQERDEYREDYEPERPSRSYRAELDDIPPTSGGAITRRIRGSQDFRTPYEDDYEEDIPRRSSRTRSRPNPATGDRPPQRRRPRPSEPPYNDPAPRDVEYRSWQDDEGSEGDTYTPPRRSERPPSRRPPTDVPRRPRPGTSEPPPRRNLDVGAPPAGYVDYQSLDDEDDYPIPPPAASSGRRDKSPSPRRDLDVEPPPAGYVDYQPDTADGEEDNSSQFDT